MRGVHYDGHCDLIIPFDVFEVPWLDYWLCVFKDYIRKCPEGVTRDKRIRMGATFRSDEVMH